MMEYMYVNKPKKPRDNTLWHKFSNTGDIVTIGIRRGDVTMTEYRMHDANTTGWIITEDERMECFRLLMDLDDRDIFTVKMTGQLPT